ncbi:Rtc4p SKDI_14G0770 [Saccharomyces kudriavzevii IFO 1802]|uniref:Restriction of telomere capping protein 4 n=2 Tax=Saccharomyces kudriavzevii (strain ATCC MYA-4449 / AS 2.2408 / CBS 8840 / NBRC 1802 / NCYC 2889) TaxID=226230 RepID=J4U518_SACK1|nr:uncharacterized protein SKDI_14G0770 [Saccharomyces kudriavzevii IFO 1802]EJT44985.1 RTC4-like protein [Saccharomyces kudriavzevii IFO 1802]CAI4049429.1 hypothetical protein SKDI_14G0770 [Saccharomyces kudriavzevii IFO 1802]
MAGPNVTVNQARRKGVYFTKKGNADNLLLMKRQGKHGIQDAENDGLSNREVSTPVIKRAKADDIFKGGTEVEKSLSTATFDKVLKPSSDSEIEAARKPREEEKEEQDISISLIQNLKSEDIESVRCRSSNLFDGRKLLLEAELSAAEDNQVFSSSFPEEKKLSLQSCLSSREQIIKKLQTRKEYTGKFNLPPMLFSDELLNEIEPFMPIVVDILKGRVSSAYYFKAKNAYKDSEKAYLSVDEFRKLNLNRFTAGFYGLKRQLRVGEEISKRYRKELTHDQPATLRWWGVADFCNYILAPEILTSFCIHQLNLYGKLPQDKHTKNQRDKKQLYYDPEIRMLAYDLLEDTVEYGTTVADSDPIEQWEVAIEEDRLRELNLDVHDYSSKRWRVTMHDQAK